MAAEPRNSSTQAGPGAAVALTAALLTLVLAPTAAIGRSPPEVYPKWLLVGAMSLVTPILALGASARRVTVSERLVAAVALGLGLVAGSIPLSTYLFDYRDYPWPVLGPVMVWLLVGGWRWGQRWLCLCLPAFLVFWFHGAARAPAPTSLQASAGDLTVTTRSFRREGATLVWRFQLDGPRGVNLAERYDLDGIQLNGTIPPGIPVRCWRPYVQDSGVPASSFHLLASPFPPAWTRSFDLAVTVPALPAHPAAEIIVTVPQPGTPAPAPVVAERDGVRFQVSDLHWSIPGTAGRSRRGLDLKVECEGPAAAAGKGWRIRVQDDQYRFLMLQGFRVEYSPTREILDGQVSPAAAVRRLKVQVYSQSELERAARTFYFRRLDNGGSREFFRLASLGGVAAMFLALLAMTTSPHWGRLEWMLPVRGRWGQYFAQGLMVLLALLFVGLTVAPFR